jgi:hypothetical protein
VLTHLIETQGLIGGLQPRRHKNSKRKHGQDTQDLERADGSVRINPNRALELGQVRRMEQRRKQACHRQLRDDSKDMGSRLGWHF